MSRNEQSDFYEERLEKIDISGVVDDMWKGLRRFWLLLLLILIVFAGILAGKARLTYTPNYTAYATYTVTSGTNSDNYTNSAAASEIGATMSYILTSKVLNTMVAEDLGVDSVPGEVRVNVLEDTNLFTISVDAETPENAYNVLQAVIRNYPEVSQAVIGMTQLDLMDESGMPTAPSNSPGYRDQIMMGLLIGFLIDFVMLLVYAVTRHTIRKEDDFKKYLNVECFGVIPRVKLKRRGKQNAGRSNVLLLDHTGISAAFKEALRSVRNRLEHKADAKGHKVILVTSAIPEEGKSTVAANIAVSLAMRGHSVILADMDLRNPSLKDVMNLKAKFGMVDVLRGRVSVEKAMLPYGETTLQVIPGGRPIGNTTRLLSDDMVEDLLNRLREEADYIILDTPPCAILSDATIVAGKADAAVFVVRQDFARVDRILEGIRNLAETGVDVCGCVLNCAQAGVTGYGYGKNYGYSRYHEYSYHKQS